MDTRSKKFLPEFVYGAVDGTVTTFAVVAGTIGAGLSPSIILILGFANLFADGFSMAASNFLSSSSKRDLGERVNDRPLATAFATFLSFVIVGTVPLAPFVLEFLGIDFRGNTFLYSCIFTGVAFLFVGARRGRITGKSRMGAAITTLLIGGCAALIAFYIGKLLQGLA